MWKQVTTWGLDVVEAWMNGLLIGHTSCNFGKKNLLFHKYCYLWEGFFQTKCNQKSLVNFPKVGYTRCFYYNFIMKHWDGQYGLEVAFFFVEKLLKGDITQIFYWKSFFFLKINLSNCALFLGVSCHKYVY